MLRWIPVEAWLYLAQLSAGGALLMAYRRGDRSWGAFASDPAGWAFFSALVGVGLSVLGLLWSIRALRDARVRRLGLALALNLSSLGAGLAVSEFLVRVFSQQTPDGPRIGGITLLPRDWSALASRSAAALARASAGKTFLTADPDLGWTIGPSRISRDYNREGVERYLKRQGRPVPRAAVDAQRDIYASSVEGLRSPLPGISLVRPAANRIAVVGDSFTFGLEVRFEDTWAHQLQLASGPETQVLNFGVDGYGVDQAYLRYRRDVASWQPERVILSVIDDDLRRSMCVYAFLCFRSFGMPFVKPRFEMDGDGELVPVNLPLPEPAVLFEMPEIGQLPYLALERSYDASEWRRSRIDASYLARLLLTRFRPSEVRSSDEIREKERREVNAALFQAFVRLARERGSIPLIAVMPSDWSLENRGDTRIARSALEASRITYLDLTPCVSQVPAEERFAALHYSARTNLAVAHCFRDAIDTGFESRFEQADE
jgi:hypothetical protein